MTSLIHYKQADSKNELLEILALQAKNKEPQLNQGDLEKEGFVYVHHDFDILHKMNVKHGHIIAKSQNEVVAYALIMDTSFKNDIPGLIPMFNIFNQCSYKGAKIDEKDYVVMGQICVEKAFRKKGLFRGLYTKMKSVLEAEYKYIITEIAVRNQRSLQAHLAIDFVEIYRYYDPNDEFWSIVLLDLTG